MNQSGQGFKHVTRGGLRFDRCPKAWIRDEARGASQFLSDFVFLDKYQILPDEGGRLDQCPRFLEAVDIISDTRAGMDDAAEKRAKQKRGKRGR